MRFLTALGRVTGDTRAPRHRAIAPSRHRAIRALAAALTPRSLTERGRMVGELLLACDEAGVFSWETLNTP